ncbi:hypothetical protein Aduo_018005 [Ancylostoma duodenale]
MLPVSAYLLPPFAPQPRSARAGLVFPVTRCHRQMKKLRVGRRVSPKAAVFMAAVLEYLVAEVLELAGYAAADHAKKRITPQHICVAVYTDSELLGIVDGTVFHEGGIVPRSFLYERNIIRV